MVWIENNLFCDGCGVEITWAPVISGHNHYCCESCRQGLECNCGLRQELEDERRVSSSSSPSWMEGV